MLVYVYGTLKRGHYNNHILQDATFVGTATLSFKARMFCVGFPVLIEGETPVKVEGELFEVDAQTFHDLDRLEGQGRMYQRRRVRIPGGKRAWVYIGKDDYWQHHPRYRCSVSPDSDNVIRWKGNGQ